MHDDVKSKISSPLPGYSPEEELAAELGVNQATLARARKQGHFEFLYWAGRVHDNREQVFQHIRSRIKRRNSPRRPRSQSRQQNQENSAA